MERVHRHKRKCLLACEYKLLTATTITYLQHGISSCLRSMAGRKQAPATYKLCCATKFSLLKVKLEVLYEEKCLPTQTQCEATGNFAKISIHHILSIVNPPGKENGVYISARKTRERKARNKTSGFALPRSRCTRCWHPRVRGCFLRDGGVCVSLPAHSGASEPA